MKMAKAYGFRQRISDYIRKGYSYIRIIRLMKKVYPQIKMRDIYRISKTMRKAAKNTPQGGAPAANPCKGTAGFLPNKMVKIYDRCLALVAVKSASSNFPREKFIHRFRKKAGVYGLPNGNILIKPE